MSAPFVYIAGLIRTGSTVLSEALSDVPHALVLYEPRFGANKCMIKPNDVTTCTDLGVDIESFRRRRYVAAGLRRLGVQGDYMVRSFKAGLLPPLREHVAQVGVKEVRHEGWEHWLRHFPAMRVVLLGRDPRDIYLSQRARMAHKRGSIDPISFATDLMRHFGYQQALARHAAHLKVRYEDLCTDESVIDEVKQFVESPVPSLGAIGSFVATKEIRVVEHELHGGALTAKRVARWKTEQDPQALREANEVAARMEAYTDYWSYDDA